MIDMIDVLRGMLGIVGLLALADPTSSGSLLTVAVAAIAVALLALAVVAATIRSRPRGSTAHPTRHAELAAPLAQSDPNAAGHVRRRGPGRSAAAA